MQVPHSSLQLISTLSIMLCSSSNGAGANPAAAAAHYGPAAGVPTPPGGYLHHPSPSYMALRDFTYHETSSNFVQDHSIHSSYPPAGTIQQQHGGQHPPGSSAGAGGSKKFWDPPNPQQQQTSAQQDQPKPASKSSQRYSGAIRK